MGSGQQLLKPPKRPAFVYVSICRKTTSTLGCSRDLFVPLHHPLRGNASLHQEGGSKGEPSRLPAGLRTGGAGAAAVCPEGRARGRPSRPAIQMPPALSRNGSRSITRRSYNRADHPSLSEQRDEALNERWRRTRAWTHNYLLKAAKLATKEDVQRILRSRNGLLSCGRLGNFFCGLTGSVHIVDGSSGAGQATPLTPAQSPR